MIVTSGAIARGMRQLDLPLRPRAMDELQAASAVGQGKLYRVYDELLASHGAPSAQVLLTFFDMSARTHYLNARQTLRKLLDWRVVPVINENDTTTTDEISFGDNDFLAAQVAVLIGADLLVMLTDTDGLYTADPRANPDAALVEEVSDYEGLTDLDIGHAGSPLGSGGMRSKVVAAEMATAAGITAVIANGLTGDALEAALAGEPVGTRFPPRSARYSSFKLWLKYAKPSHGQVLVDPGAARALREGGTSLLPVGRPPRRRSTGTISCSRNLSEDGHHRPHRDRRLPRGQARLARAGAPGHGHAQRRVGSDRRRARGADGRGAGGQ